MGIEHHLLHLARIYWHKQKTAMAEPDIRRFHGMIWIRANHKRVDERELWQFRLC